VQRKEQLQSSTAVLVGAWLLLPSSGRLLPRFPPPTSPSPPVVGADVGEARSASLPSAVEGSGASIPACLSLSDRLSTSLSHLFFQRKPSANLYACQDQVSCI
jgi:hypothetical protein